jgi:hypothetical protein
MPKACLNNTATAAMQQLRDGLHVLELQSPLIRLAL